MPRPSPDPVVEKENLPIDPQVHSFAKEIARAVVEEISATDSEINKTRQEFFSISELRIRWGVSRRTVEQWIANDRLKPTKFGTAIRVHVSEISRFERGEKS